MYAVNLRLLGLFGRKHGRFGYRAQCQQAFVAMPAEADTMLAELEARYDDARLAVLVHAEGYDRPAEV
jgi:hypothetical protein